MSLSPRLLALATAVPPHALGQEEVVERVKRLFGRSVELGRTPNSRLTRSTTSSWPSAWGGTAVASASRRGESDIGRPPGIVTPLRNGTLSFT